ncbi:MAG: zeta toxin family protein [Elusimicrobiales bacterium]|nr:zeta toxin family protein [Elusimicrobiales bacterium]
MELLVIAGANGAGKTTFAEKYADKYLQSKEFINIDLMAKGISPLNYKNVFIEAGKLAFKRINQLLSKKSDFSFETTLSGKGYIKLFKRIKNNGYKINIVYLYIPDVNFAVKRVRERVKHGGHSVDDTDIRRRFYRSIHNLFNLYWDILDDIEIIDNSSFIPKIIAVRRDGNLNIIDDLKFNQMKRWSEYEEKI